jgi:hypothetical protein
MYRKGLALIFLALSGCVTQTKPIDEFVLARAALEAAKQVEAAKYSPGFWYQAEESYKKAQELYENREYNLARDLFLKSKSAAEKAENSSRLIRQKNGEVL